MCLDGRQIYAFQEQLFFSHSLCLFSNPEIYPQILLNQHIKNPILKFALKRWEYEVFGNLKRKNKLYTLHWEDAQGNKYTGSPSCNSTTKLGPGDDLIWNERASVQYIYAHCMPSFRINHNNDSWTLNCLFRNCCTILSQTQFPTKFVQRLPYIEYVM